MDLVLGLSLTTTAVRWVLVEGTTGEGDPIDRGELDIPAIDSPDAELLVHAVLNPDVIAEQRIRVVGVTSTRDAEPAAAAVVAALAARGHHHVVSISDDAAVAALASGIVGITGYDDVAVCVVEPDSAFVALVNGGEVAVEHLDRPADRADALELTSSVITTVLDDRRFDAIFVIGSDDADAIVTSFEAITDAPVFSAVEADLAMARGAALASARTLDMSGPGVPGLVRRSGWRVGVLTAVLAAAAVTFVISLSLALGPNLKHDSPSPPGNVTAADESDPLNASRTITPRPTARSSVTFPNASRALAKTMIVKAPPAPPPVAAPVYAPPAAPPPPAYQAPAPVYVPAPPKPRLRDRIIERIPIIGRFHEPGQ